MVKISLAIFDEDRRHDSEDNKHPRGLILSGLSPIPVHPNPQL